MNFFSAYPSTEESTSSYHTYFHQKNYSQSSCRVFSFLLKKYLNQCEFVPKLDDICSGTVDSPAFVASNSLSHVVFVLVLSISTIASLRVLLLRLLFFSRPIGVTFSVVFALWIVIVVACRLFTRQSKT